jgi:hypothetical protein
MFNHSWLALIAGLSLVARIIFLLGVAFVISDDAMIAKICDLRELVR